MDHNTSASSNASTSEGMASPPPTQNGAQVDQNLAAQTGENVSESPVVVEGGIHDGESTSIATGKDSKSAPTPSTFDERSVAASRIASYSLSSLPPIPKNPRKSVTPSSPFPPPAGAIVGNGKQPRRMSEGGGSEKLRQRIAAYDQMTMANLKNNNGRKGAVANLSRLSTAEDDPMDVDEDFPTTTNISAIAKMKRKLKQLQAKLKNKSDGKQPPHRKNAKSKYNKSDPKAHLDSKAHKALTPEQRKAMVEARK